VGYTKSKRAIKHVEIYLQQLVVAKGSVEFPVDDASKFAYYLREAFKVAKLFAKDEAGNLVQPFADYAALHARFIVRVKGNTVVCEPRDDVTIPTLREQFTQINIPDVKDTLGIIGAAIKHKASTMVFPHASKETIDAGRVFHWASNNEYFLVVSENHVTLTKIDPGELAWHPA
jgi:hypothetical protein